MSAKTKRNRVVKTPERIQALLRVVQNNPGVDTETLCEHISGVSRSSVHEMLHHLESEGLVLRRRPSTRVVWYPCANEGIEVLLQLYCPPPPNWLNVVSTRRVRERKIHKRDKPRRAEMGVQSSLGGGNYVVGAHTIGGRRGSPG